MVKPQNPTTTSPFKRREQKSNKKPKIIPGNPNSCHYYRESLLHKRISDGLALYKDKYWQLVFRKLKQI